MKKKNHIDNIVTEGIKSIKSDLSELSRKKKRAKAEKLKKKEKEAEKKAKEDSNKKGGLQKITVTQQDIWDASRGSVHKDKKKEKDKYAGRKDKHKNKDWH